MIEPDGQRRSSVRIDYGLTVNGHKRLGTVKVGQERPGTIRNDQERSWTEKSSKNVQDGSEVVKIGQKWSESFRNGQEQFYLATDVKELYNTYRNESKCKKK